MPSSPSYLSFIEATLLEASDVLLAATKTNISSELKSHDSTMVTPVDSQVGSFITERILATYPQHCVVEEEHGVLGDGSELIWVIDPIDGTSSFANGVPLYGIMIGLLQDYKPLAGGVYLPILDTMVIGQQNQGVFVQGEKVSVSTHP